MEQRHRHNAEQLREQLSRGPVTPAEFRTALLSVPTSERDAWLDVVFGLAEVMTDDGPWLPANCTPYLPCPVDAVLRALEHAELCSSDVFVDVGCGVGRAALLAQLATGASAVGLEIQPALAIAARALANRLRATGFTVLEGDAPDLVEAVPGGSVFFLYCPFGGERLERTLEGMARVARTRPIRVCAVQLPSLARHWLEPLPLPEGELAVYRSVGTRWNSLG